MHDEWSKVGADAEQAATALLQATEAALQRSLRMRSRASEAVQQQAEVRGEVQQQLTVYAQLVEQVSSRYTSVRSTLAGLHQTAAVVPRLDAILTHLADTAVDQRLVAPGADAKTLFDFVDGDAIDELKDQASQLARHLSQVAEHAAADALDLASELDQLRAKEKLVGVSPPPASVWQVEELRVYAQQTQDELLRVREFNDALAFVVRSKNQPRSTAVAGVEKRLTADVPALRAFAQQAVTQREQVLAIDARVKAAADTFRAACVSAREECRAIVVYGPKLKARVAAFHTLEKQFGATLENIKQVYQELENLVNWYKHFCDAYTQLLVEIPRRHEEMARQHRLVDEAQAQLARLFQTEFERREAFFQSHGQFLPETLCPAITEAAPRFQIVPERFVSDLPRLSARPPPHPDVPTQQRSAQQQEQQQQQQQQNDGNADGAGDASNSK